MGNDRKILSFKMAELIRIWLASGGINGSWNGWMLCYHVDNQDNDVSRWFSEDWLLCYVLPIDWTMKKILVTRNVGS